MKWTACLLRVLFMLSASMASAAPLPPDSIYQLDARFTNQAGRDFHLADNRGKPVLIAMFYTSCRDVCPMLIDGAMGIDHALLPAERARLAIVFISMDPDRDDVAALRAVTDKRHLDTSRWTLARTDKTDVRKLAALLGVRYRALANGDFNHTSALYLLDGEGRVVAHSDRLGPVPEPDFLAAVRGAVAVH